MSVERQIELGRRYHRKAKMHKLKAKLATATGADREKILYKIGRLSPFWTEASLEHGKPDAPPAEKKEPKKKAAPAKKKA